MWVYGWLHQNPFAVATIEWLLSALGANWQSLGQEPPFAAGGPEAAAQRRGVRPEERPATVPQRVSLNELLGVTVGQGP